MSNADIADLPAGPDVPDGGDGRDTAGKYYLELTGQVIDDQDPDEVADRLARLLRMPRDQARGLLEGRPYRIRRELDLAKAKHLLGKLTARGAGAIIEPVERRRSRSAPSLHTVATPAEASAPTPESSVPETTAEEEPLQQEEVLDYELDIEIGAPTPFALVTGDGDLASPEAADALTPETSEEAQDLGAILTSLQTRQTAAAEAPEGPGADGEKGASGAGADVIASMAENEDATVAEAMELSLVEPAPEQREGGDETAPEGMDRVFDGEEIEIEVTPPTAGFPPAATGAAGEGVEAESAPEPLELSLDEPPAPDDDAAASADRVEVDDLDLTLVLPPQQPAEEETSPSEGLFAAGSPPNEQDDEATRPMEAVSPDGADADEHVVLEMPAAGGASTEGAEDVVAPATAGWRARLATVDRRIGHAAVGALLLAGAGWAALQFLSPASPPTPGPVAQPAPVDPALAATRQRQLALVRSVKVWMIEFGAGFDPAQVTMQRLQRDLGLGDKEMRDGWGTAFRYRPGKGEYVLASAGPDRRFDSDDDLVRTVRLQ